MATSKTIYILIQAKDEASAVLRKTGDSLKRTADDLNTVGQGVANVGSTLTRSMTLPMAALGAGALKMAGDFEQSLNVLQSVTGATDAQMSALRKTARDLGNDVSLPGISAKDAAGAMTELAKAGLTVNDTMAASKGVLSLAKAGQLDVADAAMTTARALNAFGLQGSDANRIADLLAASANASTASVQDMALGLQMAGAQSHAMGVNLQDTVTALAMFSNAGINGSDAGTSLKQMFIQLATPTKTAKELMQQLNLDFFDAKGNFIGLANMSQMLKDKLAGLTVEQRNSALATIFGSDATRVATILAQNGAAGFNAMSTAVNKQGAATELAAAQNKGFNGALDNLKSTAETAFIDIGTNLLPLVTRELKRLTDQVSRVSAWFNSLSTGQQDFIFNMLAITAAVGPVVLILGKMATSVSSVIKVASAFSRLVGIGGMATSAAEAGAAIGGGGGLVAALGPLGIALGAAAVIGGGAWLALQKFKDAAHDATGATTGMYAPVSILTLAQQRLSEANAQVTRTSDDYTRSTHALIAAQQSAKQAHDAASAAALQVTNAQHAVTDALNAFGANSPQYQAAVAALKQRQDELNTALWNTANTNLSVSATSFDVTQKLGLQSEAVNRARAAQDDLNRALHGGVDVIHEFGPAAAGQVAAIDTLQVHIGYVISSWNGWNGQLQNQLPNQTLLLQGLGSSINRVQGQGDNLVRTLQNASQLQVTTGGGLQGGSSSLQGPRHALGTTYAPGGRTLVGEHGPEYVDLPKGSKVSTAEQSRNMSAGAGTTNILSGNFTFHTAEAVKSFFDRLDKTQRLAAMGLA